MINRQGVLIMIKKKETENIDEYYKKRKQEYLEDLQEIYKYMDKRILTNTLAEINSLEYLPSFDQYDTKVLKKINKDIEKNDFITYIPVDDLIELSDAIETSKEYIFDENELKKQYDNLESYLFDKYIRDVIIKALKDEHII